MSRAKAKTPQPAVEQEPALIPEESVSGQEAIGVEPPAVIDQEPVSEQERSEPITGVSLTIIGERDLSDESETHNDRSSIPGVSDFSFDDQPLAFFAETAEMAENRRLLEFGDSIAEEQLIDGPLEEGTGPGDYYLDDRRIDVDALKVVRRLVRYGYSAYLVGGGVRDLLLGRRPKDFDVATDARPEAIRSLFRNSRIIGRRFRLVHVLFSDRKVIEVATFRRNPQEVLEDSDPNAQVTDELLIRNDNAFGEAHEDAARRDLTINALFYDVDRRKVIDFVGGLEDIRKRVIRTIGDPEVRFREDPVRMLRVIKFSSRLDLGIEAEVYDAMVLCRDCIANAARPRLLEELLKLMRSGAARRSIWLTWETGLLEHILPELSTLLDDDNGETSPSAHLWRVLGEIDRRTKARQEPLHDVVLLTSLLIGPLWEALFLSKDRMRDAVEFAEPAFMRLAVPRRISDAICRILAIYPRILAGKPGRYTRMDIYPFGAELASIDLAVR